MIPMKWLGQKVDMIFVRDGAACCANCAHFHQHYVLSRAPGHGFAPICWGHCDYPRIKNRNGLDGCERYEPKEHE